MTDWVTRCMIVPAAVAPAARLMVEGLSGWPDMFTVALNATGSDIDPATHYISNGLISAEFAALLDNPDALYAAASGAGLDATLEGVTSLLGACIVSDDSAHSVLAGLGLKVVRGAE